MIKPISLPIVEYGGTVFRKTSPGCTPKNVVFIETTVGTQIENVVSCINQNKRALIRYSNSRYDHIDSLNWLFSEGHKDFTSAALYGDVLVESGKVSSKTLLHVSKFIFLIGEPQSVNEYVNMGLSEERAARAYGFRLRRICETAYAAKNKCLITTDDLRTGEWANVVENFLSIKIPRDRFAVSGDLELNKNTKQYVTSTYERHMRYIKNLIH